MWNPYILALAKKDSVSTLANRTDSYFTPDVHTSPLVTDEDPVFNLTMSTTDPGSGKAPQGSLVSTNGLLNTQENNDVITAEPLRQADLQVFPSFFFFNFNYRLLMRTSYLKTLQSMGCMDVWSILWAGFLVLLVPFHVVYAVPILISKVHFDWITTLTYQFMKVKLALSWSLASIAELLILASSELTRTTPYPEFSNP